MTTFPFNLIRDRVKERHAYIDLDASSEPEEWNELVRDVLDAVPVGCVRTVDGWKQIDVDAVVDAAIKQMAE